MTACSLVMYKENSMKVLKFGGTSMANAASIRRVADIVNADPQAKYVVVSAPGKREAADVKVTDLLYECIEVRNRDGLCDAALEKIIRRFDDIVRGLQLDLDLTPEFNVIRDKINGGAGSEYAASRGEFLAGIVMAKLLGVKFVDAGDIIRFDMEGNFDSETTNRLVENRFASGERAVVPGFYGKMPNGKIKTFSRGGSDVTGAIVARGVGADMYENWTDVDGFMTVDPRIQKDPDIIEMLTYKELRELSYMGANVLHPESIFPVRKADIPINIRNTFHPSAPGTMIVPTKKYMNGEYKRADRTITGIAGKTDFAAIYVEKSMMNSELGFARRLLKILERHNILLEHLPSGIDTMTVVIDASSQCPETMQSVLREIKEELSPNNVEYVEGIALVAVVGHGMNRKKGTAARVFRALSDADVNIRMIDQGSSELNIIIGVENSDCHKAIRAIYKEFSA